MYRPIGYEEQPPFRMLFNSIKALFPEENLDVMARLELGKLHKMAEDRLIEVLEDRIPKFGKVYSVSITDLISLEPEFFHVIAWYLRLCGRLDGDDLYPTKIQLRKRVGITLADILDWSLYKTLNPIQLPKKGTMVIPMPRVSIISHLASFVQHVVARNTLKDDYRAAWITWVNSILWKIKTNKPLSQLEKSVVIQSTKPTFDSKELSFVPAQDPTALLSAADLIASINENCTISPKSAMVSILSNGSLESTIVNYSTNTPTYVISQGYEEPFGRFTILKFDTVNTVSQKSDEIISVLSKSGQSAVALDETSFTFGIAGKESLDLDEPDVSLVWDRERIVYEYVSQLKGRILRTADPEEYWAEKGALNQIDKPVAMANQSLDRFKIVDLGRELLESGAVRKGPDDPIVDVNRKMKMAVWKVERAANGKHSQQLSVKQVNLKSILYGGGDFIRPANGDAYVADESSILRSVPEIMPEIQGQLGLTSREREINEWICSIQYNAWFLREILGTDSPAVKLKYVAKVVSALTNKKVDEKELEG